MSLPMAASEPQVSWQDYLAIIIRRRRYVIVPCVAVVAIAMAIGFSLPKIYRAETILLIQDPKIMNPLIQGMAVSSPVAVRMRLVQEELLGWTSLSRLVRQLGLDKHAQTPASFESLIKKLNRDIVVSAGKGNLLGLSYINTNPALAQTVLNTITNIYIQRNVESQTAEAETAIRFIESEMAIYKTKLEEAERVLREFKELYAMEMPVATQLNHQIIALQVQLAHLLVENTEQHPVVVQVRRQIQELKQTRNEEIKRVIAAAIARGGNLDIYEGLATAIETPADAPADPAVQTAKDVYETWVDRMELSVKTGQAQTTLAAPPAPVDQEAGPEAPTGIGDGDVMLSVTLGPRQEQELSRLKRDYDSHRNTYHEMQSRLERARITLRLGESDDGMKFKIIEPARLPLKPVSPNLWLFFWGSLAGGLFLGACAAFGAEYLDQSFQSAEDAQAALSLPVIGSISTIVTAGDVRIRQERMKRWLTLTSHANRVKARVLNPVLARVDKALLRWGL